MATHSSVATIQARPLTKRCLLAVMNLQVRPRSSLKWRVPMRKVLFCFTLAAAIFPRVSHAQITMDMSRLTCADYSAMSAGQARIFSAWMSGWFNHKLGYVSVGFDDFARNVASVSQWCLSNPQETIMAA